MPNVEADVMHEGDDQQAASADTTQADKNPRVEALAHASTLESPEVTGALTTSRDISEEQLESTRKGLQTNVESQSLPIIEEVSPGEGEATKETNDCWQVSKKHKRSAVLFFSSSQKKGKLGDIWI